MNLFGDVVSWLTTAANWHGPNGVWTRLGEHVYLSAASLAIVCVVVLPIAMWFGHIGRGEALVLNVANVGRAVPTFALLSVFSLTALGFGTRSVVLALVLFGIPPVMTSTFTGVRGVDPDVVEAARGTGMTGWQVLTRVELPLAMPLVMSGIRLAAVQIVATLTIASLVAGPGLGRLISQGIGTQDDAELVSGAILVLVLALLVEGILAWLERRLRSGHGRRLRARAGGSVGGAL